MRRCYRRQDLRFSQTGNTGEKFIGTQRMGRGVFEEGDRRYQYSVPQQSNGDMVTVIGIQEQDTLTYVKGATPNMLSGELDQ